MKIFIKYSNNYYQKIDGEWFIFFTRYTSAEKKKIINPVFIKDVLEKQTGCVYRDSLEKSLYYPLFEEDLKRIGKEKAQKYFKIQESDGLAK